MIDFIKQGREHIYSLTDKGKELFDTETGTFTRGINFVEQLKKEQGEPSTGSSLHP